MSQPMASTDQIGINMHTDTDSTPASPIKKAPVAKKARAKGGAGAGGHANDNDFDFKFGFNFQSPAKTIRSPLFWRAVLGELVATTLFLYICLTCVMFNLNGMQPAAVTNISLCFGLTITILVYSFAGISGANINPAVTLGLAITRKMSLFRAVCYILAQLLGATIGAAMARHVSPEIFDRYNGGVNFIGADVTVGGAFLAEFMGTFVLVFTVFCAIDTERGDEVFHMPTLAPLAIGLSVTLCHFGMIGIDNCSINPARSFGASAITGIWKDHWLFWFGPFFGATAAAFMYELVFKSRKHWENKYLPYNSA